MYFDERNTQRAKEKVGKALGLLNKHLNYRTFLVGERVSLADISMVCSMLWLFKHVLEPAFYKPYPNVTRWFISCINLPQFKAVLGEVQLCKEITQFDFKMCSERQSRSGKPTKLPKHTPKRERTALGKERMVVTGADLLRNTIVWDEFKKEDCPFCDSMLHKLNRCSEFKLLSMEQKSGWVRANKRCWKCAWKHKSAQCDLRTNCTLCEKRHLDALHEVNMCPIPAHLRITHTAP